MDQFMDDIVTDAEALVAKARESLEKECLELERKKKMVASLPKNLPLAPKALHGTGYKCDCGLSFEMTSREQALELMAVLPPVDVVLVRQKGGFTSFMPRSRFDGLLKPDQTATPVAGVKFDAEGYGGGYTREEFEWWTQLGDQLAHVKLRMNLRTAGGVTIREEHDRVGRKVTKVRWAFEKMPEGQLIYWHQVTDKEPGEMTVYWADEATMRQSLLTTRTVRRVGK